MGHCLAGSVGIGNIVGDCADDGYKGIVFDRIGKNQIHIIDTGVMVLIRKTVRIDKMGPCRPHCCRLLIHQSRKRIDISRYVFRNGNCGVVPAAQHQTV